MAADDLVRLVKGKTIAPKRARGRPTKYSPAVAKAVCKMLAMGMTVNQIGRRDKMPKKQTIIDWALDPDHPFYGQYLRARTIGYIGMGDEIIDIADDSRNDWVAREMKDGVMGVALNRDALDRAKLRIDTRKWLLSKALPKFFGDKVAVEHTGKDGGPIETATSPEHPGADPIAAITKRYAGKASGATVDGSKGPAGGSGLH